jgi:hypothetical protein
VFLIVHIDAGIDRLNSTVKNRDVLEWLEHVSIITQ